MLRLSAHLQDPSYVLNETLSGWLLQSARPVALRAVVRVSVGDLVTKKRSPWLQCPLWTLEGAPGPQLTPVLGACFQCDKMLSTVSNKEKALFARSTGCGA